MFKIEKVLNDFEFICNIENHELLKVKENTDDNMENSVPSEG